MPPKKKQDKEKLDVPINQVINFYELKDVQVYMDKSHNPNFKLHNIKLPFRSIIVGASGSMKSNLVLNLLRAFDGTFNRIELYCRCAKEPLYEFLQHKLDKELFSIYEGLDHLNEQDLNKYYDKDDQTLVIFDDLVQEPRQHQIGEIYLRGRKLNVSCVYLTQKYFQVPKMVRGQTSYVFLKKISGKGDLRRILNETSLGATVEQLFNMYKFCLEQSPQSFLLIDLEASESKQYRLDFDKYLDKNAFTPI